MTHVRISPYYPQSNGKIERWHKSLKGECIRPGTPLTPEDGQRLIQEYEEHYNTVRLHSAVGYVTPADMLAGRQALDFRRAPSDKSSMAKYLFGGFEYCLFPAQKFHSDTERRLAVILERERAKWFKPAKGQFQIYYKAGVDHLEYQPDFVAELPPRRQGSLPRRLPRILRTAVRAPTRMRFNQARPRMAQAHHPRRERSAMFIR